ncbi:hypothetical protein [Nocardia sp. NPDC055049]
MAMCFAFWIGAQSADEGDDDVRHLSLTTHFGSELRNDLGDSSEGQALGRLL